MTSQAKKSNIHIRTTKKDLKQFHKHAQGKSMNLSELFHSLIEKDMKL